jgi:hypothetical protein
MGQSPHPNPQIKYKKHKQYRSFMGPEDGTSYCDQFSPARTECGLGMNSKNHFPRIIFLFPQSSRGRAGAINVDVS